MNSKTIYKVGKTYYTLNSDRLIKIPNPFSSKKKSDIPGIKHEEFISGNTEIDDSDINRKSLKRLRKKGLVHPYLNHPTRKGIDFLDGVTDKNPYKTKTNKIKDKETLATLHKRLSKAHMPHVEKVMQDHESQEPLENHPDPRQIKHSETSGFLQQGMTTRRYMEDGRVREATGQIPLYHGAVLEHLVGQGHSREEAHKIQDAVTGWTGTDHEDIRAHQLAKATGKQSNVSPEAKTRAKALQSWFNGNSFNYRSDRPIYRGVKFQNKEDRDSFLKKLKENNGFYSGAHASWTSRGNTLVGNDEFVGNRGLIYMYKNPKNAKSAEPFSITPFEKEVMTDPRHFKLENLTTVGEAFPEKETKTFSGEKGAVDEWEKHKNTPVAIVSHDPSGKKGDLTKTVKKSKNNSKRKRQKSRFVSHSSNIHYVNGKIIM